MSYTPDEAAVRRAYRYRALYFWGDDGPFREYEFDRFLARVKAEVWEEGLWAGEHYHAHRRDHEDMLLDVEPEAPANPYREGDDQ